MLKLLEGILFVFFAESLEWYQHTILVGFTRFPQLFLSVLLTYLVIQLFSVMFPPFRKFMMFLALPFRYMHIWLHVEAAKKINKKKKVGKYKEAAAISLWTQARGNDCAQISLKSYSTQDALKIATAPLKGAIALLLFIVLSSPILAELGIFGLLIHIYFIFSCFGVAWPSFSDYSFLYQAAMVHPNSLSPGYLLWVYFIFVISGYITLKRTGSPVSALVDGIFFSFVYLVGLLFLSKIIKPKKENLGKKYHFFSQIN
ncbi:MAG: hypothetical protein ACFFDT_19730 [Candidatus Hodarchaeota archaeon]